jgi:DNA-binding SARP family transcriptional activator/tetratricopeptide (TPR) repeat protein
LLNPGRTVSVDGLCDALWGDRPPQSASKVLQNVVLRLRRALGASTIATGVGGYSIDLTTGATDVAEFERLVAEARSSALAQQWPTTAATFIRAFDLWRGCPFEDLAEWMPGRIESARLEELKRCAAEELANAQLACGRHHDWIGELELLAEVEPLREKRWELLALALYRDGRQADAMRAFHRAREHLADVGLDLSPSMRDLARGISTQDPDLTFVVGPEQRRHDEAADLRSSSSSSSSSSSELPPELQIQAAHGFVGRSIETQSLVDTWQVVAGGHRRVALIGGEAGVGKSRLAIEFCRDCHARDASVFTGHCDSDVALAYQPWISVIEQAAKSMSTADRVDLVAVLSDLSMAVPTLERLVPDLRASRQTDPDAQRQRLFAAMNELLVTLAAKRPVIVLIEDIHWAGAQTLALLGHLARIKDSARLMVIASYRDGLDEITEPLASLLGELHRSDQIERIAVGGLEPSAVASIVAEGTGREVDDSPTSLAAFIHERTDGNAFYTCELFRHLRATGAVDQTGVRQTRALHDRAVPDSVREVVAARVSRLCTDARAVLDVAAVAGTRVEIRILAAATPSDCDVATACDELVSAGLLVAVDGPWLSVQFAHAIVRDTVESAILPTHRARTHLRLGLVIEQIYEADRRPVLAELARHYVAAATLGDAGKAVYYSRRAAAHAVGALAFDEAILLLAPVLELTTGQPAERLGVVMDLGEALTRNGRHAEAREAYVEAFDLAGALGQAEMGARAAVGFERSSQMPGIPGHEAALMLSKALDLLGEDESKLHLQTEAALASALSQTGLRREASVRLANVFDRARRANDPASLSSALTAALSLEDEPNRVLELCDELEALTSRGQDPYHLMFALTCRFRVLVILGRLDDARSTLRTHQDAITRGTFLFYQYAARVEAAGLAIADADFDLAERNAITARELAADENAEVGEGLFGLQMFVIRREQARLREVLPVARMVAARPMAGAKMWAPGIAALYAELGMLDEVRAHLDVIAADHFGAIPRDSLWPVCASFLADACIAAGSKPLAEIIADELRPHEGRNLMAGMTVCVGPADRYLARLAAFLGDGIAADAHFAAALDLAERSGSPLWRAQVLADWAAHVMPGDATLRRDRALQALSLAQRHGLAAVASRCRSALANRTARKPTGASPTPSN